MILKHKMTLPVVCSSLPFPTWGHSDIALCLTLFSAVCSAYASNLFTFPKLSTYRHISHFRISSSKLFQKTLDPFPVYRPKFPMVFSLREKKKLTTVNIIEIIPRSVGIILWEKTRRILQQKGHIMLIRIFCQKLAYLQFNAANGE